MPSMDRAGRHDANPFRSGHAAVKRQMESGFDLDELASAIEEVDHVSVWPETEDRLPGRPYHREHFRIVEQGRIRGFHNAKRPVYVWCERDPRLLRAPTSFADAVKRARV